MANTKTKKNPSTKTKRFMKDYTVWIEGTNRLRNYCKKKIEEVCGPSDGSGSGPEGWDVSYFDLSKAQAQRICEEASNLDFTRTVRMYNSIGAESRYFKGERD